MKADDAKRLKELESENTMLKRLLAGAELDKAMLKHLNEGKWVPLTRTIPNGYTLTDLLPLSPDSHLVTYSENPADEFVHPNCQ